MALSLGQLRGSVWPAPDAPELLPRAIGPGGRAQVIEDRERGPQCLIGESLLLPTAVQLTLGQQGSGALERHRQAVMRKERAVERRGRLGQVAVGRGEQGVRACLDRE